MTLGISSIRAIVLILIVDVLTYMTTNAFCNFFLQCLTYQVSINTVHPPQRGKKQPTHRTQNGGAFVVGRRCNHQDHQEKGWFVGQNEIVGWFEKRRVSNRGWCYSIVHQDNTLQPQRWHRCRCFAHGWWSVELRALLCGG